MPHWLIGKDHGGGIESQKDQSHQAHLPDPNRGSVSDGQISGEVLPPPVVAM
jgi:hypothetical protein